MTTFVSYITYLRCIRPAKYGLFDAIVHNESLC